MFRKRLKIFRFKQYFFSIVLFFLVISNTLNAETIVYIQYKDVEQAYYRITEVDGNIVDEVRIDDDETPQ